MNEGKIGGKVYNLFTVKITIYRISKQFVDTTLSIVLTHLIKIF